MHTALLHHIAAHQPGAHIHGHINFVGQHYEFLVRAFEGHAGAKLAQLVEPPAGSAASTFA